MSQRGEKQLLDFGGVRASVSLYKTDAKAREAQHETRRGDEPSPAELKERADIAAEKEATEAEAELGEMLDGAVPDAGGDAFGTVERHDPPARPQSGGGGGDAFGGGISPFDDPGPFSEAPDPGPDPQPDPDPEPGPDAEPEPPLHRGVWGGEDKRTWVDLGEQLDKIDADTKLDAMEVVATIPSALVPRERVRDAKWIAPQDEVAGRALALIGLSLREKGAAAVVRRTKRTSQALGIIVARRFGRDYALVLLEVEWKENMRKPEQRVLAPHRTGEMKRPLTERELETAGRLIESMRGNLDSLDGLRDERQARRAELLQEARETGEAPAAPEPEQIPDEVAAAREDLASAFVGAEA